MNWFTSPSTKCLKNKSCDFFSLLLRARFYSLLMLRQLHKRAKNKRYLGNDNACLVAKKFEG